MDGVTQNDLHDAYVDPNQGIPKRKAADTYVCTCGQVRSFVEKPDDAHQHDRDYHDCQCSKCVAPKHGGPHYDQFGNKI